MESLNPGGSVKDRIALAMVEDAERRGRARSPAPRWSSRPAATPASASRWCARCGATGYPDHARRHERGAAAAARALRRRDPPHAGHRGHDRRGLRGAGDRAASIPDYFMPHAVREPGQPRGAPPHHRARDPRGDRRAARRVRGRRRHRRHHHRRRRGAQGAACPACGSSAVEPARSPVLSGGRFRPARHPGHRRVVRARRPQSRRPRRDRAGARRGRHRDGAPAGPRGGPAGRASPPGANVWAACQVAARCARGPDRGHGAVRYWRALSERQPSRRASHECTGLHPDAVPPGDQQRGPRRASRRRT